MAHPGRRGSDDGVARLERKFLKTRSDRHLASLGTELAETYLQQGRWEDAKDVLVKSAESYARLGNLNLEAYCRNALGAVLTSLREYGAAAEQFERFMSLSCHQAEGGVVSQAKAYYHLGVCALRDGYKNSAVSLFEKAQQLSLSQPSEVTGPILAASYCGLGYVSQTQGDLWKSVADYRQAVELADKCPRLAIFALNNLGVCYMSLESPALAVSELRRACELARNTVLPEREQVRFHFHLALALVQNGEIAEARMQLEETLGIEEVLASRGSHEGCEYIRAAAKAMLARVSLEKGSSSSVDVHAVLEKVTQHSEACASLINGRGPIPLEAACRTMQAMVKATLGNAEEATEQMVEFVDMSYGESRGAGQVPELKGGWKEEAVASAADAAAIQQLTSDNARVFHNSGSAFEAVVAATIDQDADRDQTTDPTTATSRWHKRLKKESVVAALDRAQNEDQVLTLAAALRCMAMYERQECNPVAELEYLKQLEELLKETEEKGWYADVCRQLVCAYVRYGKHMRQAVSRGANQRADHSEAQMRTISAKTACEQVALDSASQVDWRSLAQEYVNRYKKVMSTTHWDPLSDAEA